MCVRWRRSRKSQVLTEDRDILALAMDDRDAVVQVFFVREGRLIGREHFHVTIGAEDTKKEVLSTFISQYYAGTPFVPKEIMLPMEIEDADVVAQWLSAKRGQKVYIRVPKKGQREKIGGTCRTECRHGADTG